MHRLEIEGVCRSCSHTPTEWQKNYDSARAFGLDASLQPIPMAQLDTSDLIAQPVVGGKVHANIHLFDSGQHRSHDDQELALRYDARNPQ